MKQIKITHKGACRFVPVNDAARLDKFIKDGWEPAKDKNGKFIIVELEAPKSNVNLLNKTNDIMAAIHAEIAETEAIDESNQLIDLDED